MARATKVKNGTAANVGYEAELWRIADALRGSMTPPSTSTSSSA
jgi:hypothetical protein